MNKIIKHVPRCDVGKVSEEEHPFEGSGELLSLDFVKAAMHGIADPVWCTTTASGKLLLMVDGRRNGSDYWRIVGYLDHADDLNLPEWSIETRHELHSK